MNASLLGLFSGFPTHHFPEAVAQVLRAYLPRRESLVFISTWPEDYVRNDDDCDGMESSLYPVPAEAEKRHSPTH